MEIAIKIIQVIIGLGLLNVWLIRANRKTPYRGGDAQNMREEFANYGLPYWFMIVIGGLKVGFAILLLVGLWFPSLAYVGAIGIAPLMAGALVMHIRVSDPLIKSLPAFFLLVLSLIIIFFV
ncbi:DoxX family protein [Marinilabilia rubra]|uniref:DoxX family protein n=1 Tax=Marinilabilia rubra TaxID=2162893 RepID=A0A2U2B9R3_9BACT|nr:DoxX family protein [Marinilabilia rubra]PWD99810.1 hypothetical protein DDZ16_07905 [Marinilabilia rubra]